MSSRRFTIATEKHHSESDGFVACPTALALASPAQFERLQEIYRLAYEKARELHQPSRWAPLYLAMAN